MLTERAIVNALIFAASLILVPYIISSTLTVDYLPAYLSCGLLAFFLCCFVLKDSLCMWPFLGGCISGTLNFLPLPLKATQVFCFLLVTYYITGYILIRQRPIKLGKTLFFWPIILITMILLYHNHAFNVRALGGGTEGSKPALLIYLVVLAYFCGINVITPSVTFVSKMPGLCVILAFVSALPFFLTTFIPGLAPFAYAITDNVNTDAYFNSLAGDTGAPTAGIGRMLAFAPIAGPLQMYLICKYPIATWLRPERWWIIGLSLIALILVLQTGFRNVLFGFVLIYLIGTWCHYSWRSVFALAIPIIAAMAFVFVESNDLIDLPLDKLPLAAQRTLSFLPGDWDPEAIQTAEDSNGFRTNIINIYLKEDLHKSPWIGNGFDIDKGEYEYWQQYAQTRQMSPEEASYVQAKIFIMGKLFHTGWLSMYDAVGIIGSIAFITLGINVICLSGHFVFGSNADNRSSLFPLYMWLFIGNLASIITFFTVFGDFKETFMGWCISAIVLSHLSDLENASLLPAYTRESKTSVPFRPAVTGAYGYRSE